MFDELQHLQESERLCRLLGHYASLGTDNRETWQDRLMSLEGTDATSLTKLHGELIGFGWIDQNTGVIPTLMAGGVAGCYRINGLGVKALKLAQGPRDGQEGNARAA